MSLSCLHSVGSNQKQVSCEGTMITATQATVIVCAALAEATVSLKETNPPTVKDSPPCWEGDRCTALSSRCLLELCKLSQGSHFCH